MANKRYFFPALLLALASVLCAPAQTVTVAENLVDQNGSALTGYVEVSNPYMLMPYGDVATVTAASNATPIQVDFSAVHGWTTGQTVYCTGMVGNTGGNGTWILTTVDTDSVTLNGSIGNGVWASDGTCQRFIPIGAKVVRTSIGGGGALTMTLYPTTTAVQTPSGSAAGFVYTATWCIYTAQGNCTTTTEQWSLPPTPTTTTFSAIRQSVTVTPTSTLPLTGLATSGASGARYDYICNGNPWAACTLGVPPNAQTGTSYTILDTDRDSGVTFSNSSAIAVTLPQAGASSQFLNGWFAWFRNINTGLVTITPATSTIDGQTTLTLRRGESNLIFSDGTNYQLGDSSWTIEEDDVPLALCQNVTAVSLVSNFTSLIPTPTCVTGSNSTYGTLQWPDLDGEYQIQGRKRLPADWTGIIDIDIIWKTAATTNSIVWQVQTSCVANAQTGDPAWNAVSTVTDAALGSTLQWNTATITSVTITNCAADETMLWKVYRQRTHASDTLVGTADLIGLRWRIRRKQ